MDIDKVQKTSVEILRSDFLQGKPAPDHRDLVVQQAETGKSSSAEGITPEQLQHVARAVEQFTSSMGRELKFHIHEESETLQVDVIDPEKNKIITTIPPDEILALAASIEETVGVFLNRVL